MRRNEIRILNFKYLADVELGRGELAKRMGYDSTNYLNQIANGHVKLGDSTAEKVEAAAGRPEGWLDVPHPALWGTSPEERHALIEELLEGLDAMDLAQLIATAGGKLAGRKE